MPCIDRSHRPRTRATVLALGVAAWIVAGCAGSSGEAPGDARGGVPSKLPPGASPPLPKVPAAPAIFRAGTTLSAPRSVRSWTEVRRQAAERIVAANPDITYTGKVPEILLAIPVLEIELNGDGSIRNIEVLRPPRQAGDTLRIAADAVRRAGPFGNVSTLPRPWKFVETFLFDDQRKFKPRTLDF